MIIDDKSHEEKRDFIRMRIDAPLVAKILGDGIDTTGLCLELSGGGMKIETEQAVVEGDILEVIVSSEYGQGATLHAKTKVVRTDPADKGYRLALEITEVLN